MGSPIVEIESLVAVIDVIVPNLVAIDVTPHFEFDAMLVNGVTLWLCWIISETNNILGLVDDGSGQELGVKVDLDVLGTLNDLGIDLGLGGLHDLLDWRLWQEVEVDGSGLELIVHA